MRALLVLALMLLAACGGPPAAGCTMIGAVSGVGVTVERSIADSISDLTLRLCYDGRCHDVAVDSLYPGSDTVPQDCPSSKDPDTTCSASAVPNGTMVGFAEVADLPGGSLTAGARFSLNGKARTLGQISLAARTVRPNGPSCPGMANQATLRVGAAGLTAG